MRDSLVDRMVSDINKGDQEGDVEMLVLGMRYMLGVLEIMKLVRLCNISSFSQSLI